MPRKPYALLAALAALSALPVAADTTTPAAQTRALVPHTAEYDISISLLGGTLRTIVDRNEYGYSARSVITPTGVARLVLNGSIEESSLFTLGEDGVRPLIYSSSDTLSKEDKFMDFRFDWSDGVVSGEINDEPFRFELDGEAHDRVSIQYELMHDLLNDRPVRDFALLDGDELKPLQISNIGTRTVKVPFGTFEAVGIQHRKAESSRVSTLWCVEELDYLPVLIEQHRRGKLRVRAELTHYAPADAPAAVHASQ